MWRPPFPAQPCRAALRCAGSPARSHAASEPRRDGRLPSLPVLMALVVACAPLLLRDEGSTGASAITGRVGGPSDGVVRGGSGGRRNASWLVLGVPVTARARPSAGAQGGGLLCYAAQHARARSCDGPLSPCSRPHSRSRAPEVLRGRVAPFLRSAFALDARYPRPRRSCVQFPPDRPTAHPSIPAFALTLFGACLASYSSA
jgi:hypothetical protein